MRYRRDREGLTYFFTVVCRDRHPVFWDKAARNVLRSVLHAMRERWPFAIDAWVLLPDHIHTIWTLPEIDVDYSRRWGWLKKEVTKRQRTNTRNGSIWQRRFWEHRIRDERDYRIHCDYIHYNPVKHGLVARPLDWPFSTFHRGVRRGIYGVDWGATAMAFPDDMGGE